jgi:hypothetical protein
LTLELVKNGDSVSVAWSDPLTLGRVGPEVLSGHWEYIRKGLLSVKERTPAATWTPEHVRREIEKGFAQGGAELYFVLRGEKPQGFYVMTPQFDPWQGIAHTWLIWIGYSTDREATDYAMEMIRRQALARGFTAIESVSSRPGWARRMAKHGYRLHQAIYRLDLYKD